MPSRRALLAGVGATSAGLAGCNLLTGDGGSRHVPGDWTPAPGEWAGPGYHQANSNHNPHASPPTSEPSVAWDAETTRPSVVVADGTVFLREPESLRGLDTGDGTERFEVSRPSGWQHRYVAGEVLWRLEGVHPEALVGETVYATTADERFVALRD